MKKYLTPIMTCSAVAAFCAFLVFLIDLAIFDRGGKVCGIWERTFQEYEGTNRGLVLMANMDILCILVSLAIFGLLALALFKHYGYRVLLIPIAGVVLFVAIGHRLLCFI